MYRIRRRPGLLFSCMAPWHSSSNAATSASSASASASSPSALPDSSLPSQTAFQTNCLSCRVIGTSVLSASCLYVLYEKQNLPRGTSRITHVTYACVSLGMAGMAIARAIIE